MQNVHAVLLTTYYTVTLFFNVYIKFFTNHFLFICVIFFPFLLILFHVITVKVTNNERTVKEKLDNEPRWTISDDLL